MFEFRHETIDPAPPANRLTNCVTTDLTGNGRPDVVVTAMGADLSVGVPGGRLVEAIRSRFQTHIFWYENPGWKRHDLTTDRSLHLDVGTTIFDVNGDGRDDIVVGQAYGRSDVYWFEQPSDPRHEWHRHLITDLFEKYHDLAALDIDDDGEKEVVGLSQNSETVFYYDVPADPTRGPWPKECLHIIDDDVFAEGVAAADLDGDGRTELVAGPNVYNREPDGEWRRKPIATGWDQTRVAIADLDEDGGPEVVLAEGDSPTYGTHPGRVAWFDTPEWEPTFLREDLFCPHTLQVVDFDGTGRPDLLIAEMGLGDHDDPKVLLYENLGNGEFKEHIVGRGVPTHEAKVVDLTGDGRLDIVGKSYEPNAHVDVWYNQG